MFKEIYSIINSIFGHDERFEIIKSKNKIWLHINYKKNKFINIYINKNEKSIIVFHYDNNNMDFNNKYMLNKKNKYYNFINVRNILENFYEKK